MVTEEVLETKKSKVIAVKVLTSLSMTADLRCRNLYATETTPPSGSKRNRVSFMKARGCLRSVSKESPSTYATTTHWIPKVGRGDKSCTGQASAL